MIRRLFGWLIFKNRPRGGVDPMPLAKELLDACADYPIAREHTKQAMRAILEKQIGDDAAPAR